MSNVKTKDLGARPEFLWIPIDSIVVDERYQRRVTRTGNSMIEKIVNEFHWSRFQPLTVACKDKSDDYPVIDGQHRLLACRKIGLTEVPCWVVASPHLADQAKAFVGTNKCRVKMTKINVFWADVVAGSPDATWVKRICDSAGVKIGRIGTGRQPCLTTIATRAIMNGRRCGEAVVARALRLIAAAHPETENAFRDATVAALIAVLDRAGSVVIDDKRMIDVLAAMDFDDEIDRARVYQQSFGGTRAEALRVVVIRAYNNRLRDGSRIPE